MSEAWTAAIEALSWIELQDMNENAALRKTLKQLRVKDRRVATEAGDLLNAVSKRRNTLDYLINSALEPTDLESLDIGLRSFLRLYTHLIHFSSSTSAEVHRFAEHVRNILGERKLKPVEEAIDLIPHQEIPWGRLSHDEVLAYRNFLPVWYVRYVCANFEERNYDDLMTPIDPPKYIRVNTLIGDDSMIPQLNAMGFRFDTVPELDHTFRVLGDSAGLTDTGPYKEGAFILQDKASILVGEVAAPRPGDVVLDICAAPGAKTSHLAQLMCNRGRIVSVELDARRLASWERLVNRMGVRIAEPVLGDASKSDGLPAVRADLVLLDPPCSGTGTFNSFPSTKWRVTQRSIEEMAGLQRRLIINAATHVKEGGSLVYSTCSVSLEENEGVIKGFLDEHPEFKLIEAKPRIGAEGLLGLKEAQRLFPAVHECEGFYIAKLSRKN